MTATTTLDAPRPPVTFAPGADEAFVGVLLGFHHEGILTLPVELVARIRAADVLQRAARDVAAQVTRADPSTTRRAVLDALKSAAAAGRLPDDAGAAAVEHQRDLSSLETRYRVLADAATEAAHEVRVAIVNGADGIGQSLLTALTKTLAEAEAPARVMRDAGPFGWNDPDALYAADKPVQAAYGQLLPLARLHDRVRGAAVALAGLAPGWQGIGDRAEAFAARQRAAVPGGDPEWRRAGGFAGYGVEMPIGGYNRDSAWKFQPTGHPVQRLMLAATDPAPEPIAETA